MTDQLINFLEDVIRIKRIVRSGWLYSGVPKSSVESVADHSFMVAILSLLIAYHEQEKGNKINIEKVLIMALLHDLPECISQDLDRRIRKFSPEKYDEFKNELDIKAFESLMKSLPVKLADFLMQIFYEILDKKTEEARIVFEADRLETLLQLRQYQHLGLNQKLFQEFFNTFNLEIDRYQIDLVKKLAKNIMDDL